MKWLVTVAMKFGPDVVVEVIATNKQDAEYRACLKAEQQSRQFCSHIVVCRKTS